MKDIKRYGCDVYYDRGMYECSGGEFVSHDDYAASVAERDMRIAALQEQVRALAAEGAIMHTAIDQTIGWQQWVDAGNTESVRCLVAIQGKTPRIDAALREIRAQAVESFMSWSDSHIEEGDEYEKQLRYVSSACKVFAARIRTGEQP